VLVILWVFDFDIIVSGAAQTIPSVNMKQVNGDRTKAEAHKLASDSSAGMDNIMDDLAARMSQDAVIDACYKLLKNYNRMNRYLKILLFFYNR
jgi:hypothetical protein